MAPRARQADSIPQGTMNAGKGLCRPAIEAGTTQVNTYMHGFAEILGFKLATLVAGFVGAIASLAYMRELTPLRALLAVLVGTGCAAYVTPVVMGWMNMTGSAGENAAAFIVGIIGMNLVGAFYRGSERMREAGIRIAPSSLLGRNDDDKDNPQ